MVWALLYTPTLTPARVGSSVALASHPYSPLCRFLKRESCVRPLSARCVRNPPPRPPPHLPASARPPVPKHTPPLRSQHASASNGILARVLAQPARACARTHARLPRGAAASLHCQANTTSCEARGQRTGERGGHHPGGLSSHPNRGPSRTPRPTSSQEGYVHQNALNIAPTWGISNDFEGICVLPEDVPRGRALCAPFGPLRVPLPPATERLPPG